MVKSVPGRLRRRIGGAMLLALTLTTLCAASCSKRQPEPATGGAPTASHVESALDRRLNELENIPHDKRGAAGEFLRSTIMQHGTAAQIDRFNKLMEGVKPAPDQL